MGGSSKIIDQKGGSRKNNCYRLGIKNVCSTASKKSERVRLMLPLELLGISPELTRVTCLATST